MRCHPLLTLFCVLGVALAPSIAQAAKPSRAQALFREGVADMEAGLFEKACPALEQSEVLDPRPATLSALADCEAFRGRIATAVARYNEVLVLHRQMPEALRAKDRHRADAAEGQVMTLEPLLPRLTIQLPPGAPQGTIVRRDGKALPDTALGVALPVDPGAHVVSVQAPGGPVTEVLVTVGRGEKKRVMAEIPAPPARTAIAGWMSARRVTVIELGDTRRADLTVGAVAIGGSGIIADQCRSDDTRAVCDDTTTEMANRLKELSTLNAVGVMLGLAGLGAAATVLLVEPRASAEGSPGRRLPGLRLDARVTAGITGAGLDLRGSW